MYFVVKNCLRNTAYGQAFAYHRPGQSKLISEMGDSLPQFLAFFYALMPSHCSTPKEGRASRSPVVCMISLDPLSPSLNADSALTEKRERL